MRKILITAGIYTTSTSRLVDKLYSEGKNVKEIQEITGLKNHLSMVICLTKKSFIISQPANKKSKLN